MINLLLGSIGAGKSFEAVVHHVLPALRKGRKVITNLPLVLEEFAKLDPSFPDLIELRTETRRPKPEFDAASAESKFKRFGIRAQEVKHRPYPFAYVEDYETDWVHPDIGCGPLFVIDECWNCLPRRGTPDDVVAWFAMSRHSLADVLLISQGTRKVNADIIDLIQLTYRLRKDTARGFENQYIRHVCSGITTTAVNKSIRKYDPKFYPLYQSHTKAAKAGGIEMGASDVVPIWRHWTFISAGFFVVLALVLFAFSGNPFNPKLKASPQTAAQRQQAEDLRRRLDAAGAGHQVVLPAQPVQSSPPPGQSQASSSSSSVDRTTAWGPYSSVMIHVAGRLRNNGRQMMLFVVSQNGQGIYTLNSDALEATGYKVEMLEDCAARLTWQGSSRYAICDLPSTGVWTPTQSARGGPSGGSPRAVAEVSSR